MLIFISIAVAAFLMVAGSFLFGHDHDGDHDHSGDHDAGTDAEPTISIFSFKVIATLLMGFGAAGAIARNYELAYLPCSLIGLGCGVALGTVMYGILTLFYKQQASSLVPTSSAVGCMGKVTVSIAENGQGEVGLQLEGQYCTFVATSVDGQPIPKDRVVKVIKTLGSQLVVTAD